MRYKEDHKEQIRQKILESAAVRLRSKGIAASGVVGLMADVGLTQGGFYSHFKSKDALVRESLQSGMQHLYDTISEIMETSNGKPLEAFLDSYLSQAHRDMPGKGCVASALSGEIREASEEIRNMFTQEVAGMTTLLSQALPESWREEERQTYAEMIYATLVGAMSLARAVNDKATSDRLLINAKKQILEMVKSKS
ncbi:TetR/AcrR family transcriptional regulator [Undibacterium terreum]|uniref:TetR family transcriptional regulator n=1 Tax=Undibacterium terreum TaxID=1224302 RepID=A0A916X9L7_9BURK|nr:TetR/AcrR family transcriptional regulator [Undibacterium terreum]GGC57560.1 TetR family transcriptional regulator [Undibacterium terreum]